MKARIEFRLLPASGPYIKDVRTDVVREVALIYYYRSGQNADKGGRGSKVPKILRTSFMYGPLIPPLEKQCSTTH